MWKKRHANKKNCQIFCIFIFYNNSITALGCSLVAVEGSRCTSAHLTAPPRSSNTLRCMFRLIVLLGNESSSTQVKAGGDRMSLLSRAPLQSVGIWCRVSPYMWNKQSILTCLPYTHDFRKSQTEFTLVWNVGILFGKLLIFVFFPCVCIALLNR